MKFVVRGRTGPAALTAHTPGASHEDRDPTGEGNSRDGAPQDPYSSTAIAEASPEAGLSWRKILPRWVTVTPIEPASIEDRTEATSASPSAHTSDDEPRMTLLEILPPWVQVTWKKLAASVKAAEPSPAVEVLAAPEEELEALAVPAVLPVTHSAPETSPPAPPSAAPPDPPEDPTPTPAPIPTSAATPSPPAPSAPAPMPDPAPVLAEDLPSWVARARMRVTAEEPPLPRLTYKRIPAPAASPEDRPLLTWAILSGIEGEAPRKAETRPPKVAPTAPDAGAYETPIEPAPAPEDGNEPAPPRSDFESG